MYFKKKKKWNTPGKSKRQMTNGDNTHNVRQRVISSIKGASQYGGEKISRFGELCRKVSGEGKPVKSIESTSLT